MDDVYGFKNYKLFPQYIMITFINQLKGRELIDWLFGVCFSPLQQHFSRKIQRMKSSY